MKRKLTDKQVFALCAVEKGVVRRKLERIGSQTHSRYFAWDREITCQIKSLRFVHRLIRFKSDGSGTLIMCEQKEKQAVS